MKKLSIEEKAKVYDEAIEKLRNAFYDNNSRMCEEYRNAVLKIIEPIFPELAESEDERIRKEIIEQINLLKSATLSDLKDKQFNSWLAWLEKQGEQKPADKVESKWKPTDKDIFELQCVINNEPYNGFILKALLEQLKKLKE